MSFSLDVKAEIVSKKIVSPCCVKAACYAVACFAKYFDGRGIVLQTEVESVAQFAKKMFHLCDIQGTIEARERASGVIYEFSVKQPEAVEQMLQMFGHNGNETTLRIHPENFSCEHCYHAFISAAFLCGGTITDPEKEYSLEFLTPKFSLARDYEAMLAEREFQPHRTLRRGTSVIYIKASERIENLLAYMGAGKAAMTIMNSRMFKEVRNNSNRISNCEAANISKRVQASVQVKKAVRYLEEQGRLEMLSQPLQKAAEMRLRYPEYTLSQLAEAFDPPLSKSGLSHQLKKIIDIAKALQERNENA